MKETSRKVTSLKIGLLLMQPMIYFAIQGKEMYDKMKEAGATIQRIVLPGTTHLFITVSGQPNAFQCALKSTIDFLQKK